MRFFFAIAVAALCIVGWSCRVSWQPKCSSF